MKVEIEIPDLEQIYFSGCYDEEITGEMIGQAIVDMAVEKFINQLYDNWHDDIIYKELKDKTAGIIKTRTEEIVNRVIEMVAAEILRKKSIVSEMPKKSEVANISKEWEQYFVELIDKAIARRFK